MIAIKAAISQARTGGPECSWLGLEFGAAGPWSTVRVGAGSALCDGFGALADLAEASWSPCVELSLGD
jgi:hypothetical protein